MSLICKPSEPATPGICLTGVSTILFPPRIIYHLRLFNKKVTFYIHLISKQIR